ncbi:unnamed protein product, partial [Mesorhabditis belari]|uniref:NR LBD domain-containing protein n=1 Tax=Mesorhabditis belari TaxID=2138241 RepID=A0AAF3EQU5_9BILA
MGSVRFDCSPLAYVDPNVDTVQALLQLESFCNGDTSECSTSRFTYNLDLSFEDVLRCPTSLCLRIPAGLSHVFPNAEPSQNLGRQFSRLLLHVIDYVRGLAEVSQLPPKEQVLFCKRQHLFVSPFLLFAYTYRIGNPGMVAGLGQAFSADSRALKKYEIGDFLERMINLGQNEVIPAFRDTQMDDGDYVLLKNILIFHSAHGLSEPSAAIVREARKKYEWMLSRRIRQKSKDDVEAIYKIAKLMGAVKKSCGEL